SSSCHAKAHIATPVTSRNSKPRCPGPKVGGDMELRSYRRSAGKCRIVEPLRGAAGPRTPGRKTNEKREIEEPPGAAFSLEVPPRLPHELARLEELANNLWFSWSRPARELFARLDPVLWEATGHSPKAVLRGVDQRRLEQLAHDAGYLHEYDRT